MVIQHVPFLHPPFGSKERAAAYRVMCGNQVSVGPETSLFEQQFKDYIGATSAISVGNGTLALELVWQTFIQQGRLSIGDKVLLPSFTFVAVANSIVRSGLVPVFCDIDSETWNIDFYNAIPDDNHISAICAVHTFGNPCDMDKLDRIEDEFSEQYGKSLIIVEDCAEAAGATYKGKRVGSFGDASIFSFSATKNMTTGEGGMACFKDQEDADMALLLKENGFGYGKRNAWVAGHNYRLSNILCAVGIEQLKTLDARNEKRVKNAYTFFKMCLEHDIPVTPQCSSSDADSVYQILGVLIPPCINRDEVYEALLKKGIEVKKYFSPAIHHQVYYVQNYPIAYLSVTDNISAKILCIPFDDKLNENEMGYIVMALKELLS
jgi:perosamine synthetase